MKLSIRHQTHYKFDAPSGFALQRLQLCPVNSNSQKVHSWNIEIEGAVKQLEYINAFGNHNQLNKIDTDSTEVIISVEGEVETYDIAGVDSSDTNFPMWIYLQSTPATKVGKGLRVICNQYKANSDTLLVFHEIMGRLRSEVPYEIGATDVTTTAEESWAIRKGVCQDHSHLMIAVARELGFPARYVSGYLLMDGIVDQSATHAWCEVYIQDLGWVGFDVSNGISPDERYVKIATGRDYSDAAPVMGIRYGDAKETLDVHLQIQQ